MPPKKLTAQVIIRDEAGNQVAHGSAPIVDGELQVDRAELINDSGEAVDLRGFVSSSSHVADRSSAAADGSSSSAASIPRSPTLARLRGEQ